MLLNLASLEVLELIDCDKCLFNPFSDPSYPHLVVVPSEVRSRVFKVNQARITNKLSELSGLNAISILHIVPLLVGPHNSIKVPVTREDSP